MSFKSDNFCHIASNNRNNVKVGVFIYRTTDNLATVSASGYFNGRITDINLHDLIIHEQVDASDNTKVERNVLCVVGRTLDNVSTAVISSKWEKDIEDTIDGLDDVFLKLDGSNIMTAPLRMIAGSMRGAIAPYWDGLGFFKVNTDESQSVSLIASIDDPDGFIPAANNTLKMGSTNKKWKDLYLGGKLYVPIINNGGDLAVPAVSGTLATKEEVDTAANSGDQLYTTGVWYAKMYAGTTPPASAEVEGRNYADFSQVDGEGNPIIVVYTYTSGAWATTETITPPAEYNGYMTITSKIWDISEQTGQQGGLVLWSHNQKTFTPYPRIVSFEDAHLTGNSTTTMPLIPTGETIVNIDYLSTHTGSGRNVGDIFLTERTDSSLNGAVDCDGNTYNTTDFVGSGSIGALLEAGKIPYVSMALYATTISNQGWCDKFGWDGTGNTTFKVPTLSAKILQKNKLTVAGNGSVIAATAESADRALYIDRSSGGDVRVSPNVSANANIYDIKNLEADVGSTVSADLRIMVQLATESTDEALETCTSVLADVAALKYDYVVDFQAPTAQNNYTWYRKYKSGWVEQGGLKSHSTGTTDITLPIEMSDTNYSVLGSFGTGYSAANNNNFVLVAYSTTTIRLTDNNSGSMYWIVSGIAA